MVVPIKDRKYEVDFFDVNVMDATENGLKAVLDFAQSVDMSVDPAGTMREALTMIKAHIDSIVGEGVTEECFGDSMNWVEIMEAWLAIGRAYQESCAEMDKQVKAMLKEVPKASIVQAGATPAIPQSVRKPVRVE